MTELFLSAAIAAAATSLYAFRYDASRAPRTLAAYFVGFFVLEFAVSRALLPPGALPLEVGYVCLGIALLVGIACSIRDRAAAGPGGTP